MALTKEELEHIVSLAALKLDEKEKEEYIPQLGEILEFVSNLNEMDVEGFEPMAHPVEDKFLDVQEGQEDFDNPEGILQNVNHSVRNNSIVIRSSIK